MTVDLLLNYARLSLSLKFHFDPGCFDINFPVLRQPHLLAGGMNLQFGFQLADMSLQFNDLTAQMQDCFSRIQVDPEVGL